MTSISFNTIPTKYIILYKGNRSTYPVATSHILSVLSLELDTKKSPDGIKTTDDTLWS